MKKIYKILIPSVLFLGIIGSFGEDKTPDTNLLDNNYTNTENINDSSKLDKDENKVMENNNDSIKDSNNKNNIDEDNNNKNTVSESKTTTTSTSKNTNSNKNNSVENSNLPLKAICNDGTISYQDDASKKDYRGMCSGHKGIKEKLGRVK